MKLLILLLMLMISSCAKISDSAKVEYRVIPCNVDVPDRAQVKQIDKDDQLDVVLAKLYYNYRILLNENDMLRDLLDICKKGGEQ